LSVKITTGSEEHANNSGPKSGLLAQIKASGKSQNILYRIAANVTLL